MRKGRKTGVNLIRSNNIRHCVGIIPCAGKQTRMEELCFSKELLPLFDGRPVIQHSIDSLRMVTNNIIAVTNSQKKDLIIYLQKKGINVLIERNPIGLPTSIGQVSIDDGSYALFALPDTYFKPIDVFKKLIKHKKENVIGLFDSGKPELFDSVKVRGEKIVKYAVKVTPPLSKWTMGCGKLSSETMKLLRKRPNDNQEVIFGNRIQPLVKKGELYGIKLHRSKYHDLGTPARYIGFLLSETKHIIDK